MKLYRLLTIISLTAFGCSSTMPIYESTLESKFSDNQAGMQLDETSDLSWQVTNDDQYLFVRLATSKRTTQTKILRAGLKIYFDQTGQKAETTYLNFPIFQERQRTSREEMGSRPGRPGQNEERRAFDLSGMIGKTPPDALFVRGEEQMPFNYLSDQEIFKVELSADTSGVLHFYAAIPFEKINPEGLQGISKLSLGIVSGAFEIPVNTGNGMNPPGGGMPGGNPRMAEMQKRMAEMVEPVKIWSGLKLTK
ncbi:MAG: hypothetical protein KDC85_23740 [Saprospiraceae bacterium]|nr:hypothetical protein [Saprospiraceae bacterium]MCB9322221.1 hypothetical protein [Lewinellaceae bacterium]